MIIIITKGGPSKGRPKGDDESNFEGTACYILVLAMTMTTILHSHYFTELRSLPCQLWHSFLLSLVNEFGSIYISKQSCPPPQAAGRTRHSSRAKCSFQWTGSAYRGLWVYNKLLYINIYYTHKILKIFEVFQNYIYTHSQNFSPAALFIKVSLLNELYIYP